MNLYPKSTIEIHPQYFWLDPPDTPEEDSNEDGGQWYTATIITDNRIASRPQDEVNRDPYGCGGLFQRYTVSDDTNKDENLMSPWELFEVQVTTEDVLEEEAKLPPQQVRDLALTCSRSAGFSAGLHIVKVLAALTKECGNL